ncbi:MAG: hypothetical protein SFW09_02145 [Hyphomicrobiaceae bacterium]|nr:hypothetical protein [Hyphomicrobiaceae bacterium]
MSDRLTTAPGNRHAELRGAIPMHGEPSPAVSPDGQVLAILRYAAVVSGGLLLGSIVGVVVALASGLIELC